MKKNQPLLHIITWNNLTDIILRQRSHMQNYILYKSVYMKFKIRQVIYGDRGQNTVFLEEGSDSEGA